MKTRFLGKKKRPMALYLTGKLVPFGSSANVVNEADLDIQTNQLTEDEKVDEHLSNRDIFINNRVQIRLPIFKPTNIVATN